MADHFVPKDHDGHPWPQEWELCGPGCNPYKTKKKRNENDLEVEYAYCEQAGCGKNNCHCFIFWWDDREPGKLHEKPWRTDGEKEHETSAHLHFKCYCVAPV